MTQAYPHTPYELLHVEVLQWSRRYTSLFPVKHVGSAQTSNLTTCQCAKFRGPLKQPRADLHMREYNVMTFSYARLQLVPRLSEVLHGTSRGPALPALLSVWTGNVIFATFIGPFNTWFLATTLSGCLTPHV